MGLPTTWSVDLKITIQEKVPNIHDPVDLSNWLPTVLKWPKAKLLNSNTISNDYPQAKNYLKSRNLILRRIKQYSQDAFIMENPEGREGKIWKHERLKNFPSARLQTCQIRNDKPFFEGR